MPVIYCDVIYCGCTSCIYCDEDGECQRTDIRIGADAGCASVEKKKLAKSEQ